MNRSANNTFLYPTTIAGGPHHFHANTIYSCKHNPTANMRSRFEFENKGSQD